MVREIVWTRLAHSQKLELFEYWNKETGSQNYSRRLDVLIDKSLALLLEFPQLGTTTQIDGIRVKIVAKNYLIIYKIADSLIYILSVWDSRQNPEDLSRLFDLYI